MLRRFGRLVPVLAVALVFGLLSAGSLAFANDKTDHQHSDNGNGNEQRCNHQCKGKQFSAWDEEWLMMSIQGDRFAIQGGKLGQQKGSGSSGSLPSPELLLRTSPSNDEPGHSGRLTAAAS